MTVVLKCLCVRARVRALGETVCSYVRVFSQSRLKKGQTTRNLFRFRQSHQLHQQTHAICIKGTSLRHNTMKDTNNYVHTM